MSDLDASIPDVVALYKSGATVQQVANAFSCSYNRARTALVSAGVELRQQRRLVRTPVAVTKTRCRDCGERLDRPHVLGPHIPGCSHGPAIPSSTLEPTS